MPVIFGQLDLFRRNVICRSPVKKNEIFFSMQRNALKKLHRRKCHWNWINNKPELVAHVILPGWESIEFLIKISIDKRTCILYITVYCMQNSEKGNELYFFLICCWVNMRVRGRFGVLGWTSRVMGRVI